jgi:hypothetical protein
MAELTQEEKDNIGPLITPFSRSTKKPELCVIKDGESDIEPFINHIHDAVKDEEPENVVYLKVEEVETLKANNGRLEEKCYLWIIDDKSIKMLRERTRNVKRAHKPQCICHTNLTGGQPARLGGEVFFCEDGRVFLNPYSDRYGGRNITNEQWEAAKAYFKKVGYTSLIDIVELLLTT